MDKKSKRMSKLRNLIPNEYRDEAISFLYLLILANTVLYFFPRFILPALLDKFIVNNTANLLPEIISNGFILIVGSLPILIFGGWAFWIMYYFRIKKKGETFKSLGFDRMNIGSNLMLGAFVGILVVCFYKIMYVQMGNDVEYMTLFSKKIPTIFYIVFIDGIITGVWEETFFVSFMYSGFKKKWGSVLAILVIACCFSLYHMPQPLYRIPRAFMHIVISVALYETRKSIIPSCAFHAIYNMFI